MEEDATAVKTRRDSKEGFEDLHEIKGNSDDHEKKEIPLEQMTKAELSEKVKELQGLTEKNFDLYIRSQAEIENLKKRYQKEKQELARFSNESLIKQLLTVMDNLEKAIEHSQDENSLNVLREGVELTLKGLRDTLQREGLEEVKAVDECFDPNFHEAVSEREDKSIKSGVVLDELQKGYILNQRLIRPARVIVSKSTDPT
ncbi:MAG: nucleotide exchange factor GrpE [Thermodesulfobacteriota bacterium]|nr:nucleotide exchange factor GrpE [Thermodesulfobacteriota bacterium]